MRMKNILAASLLAAASLSALAANQSAGTSLVRGENGDYTGGVAVSHTSAGGFTDTITFNGEITGFTDASAWTFGMSSAGNIDFTGATLFFGSNPVGIALQKSATGIYEYVTTSSRQWLSGPFRLEVSGISGAAATYTATLNVSPVPEPETYGMFAVGLGLLAFLTRRNARTTKQKNASLPTLAV